MKLWYFSVLIVLNASTTFLGMERSEHEKTLSETDVKIRDYFFAEKRLNYYFYADTYHLNRLSDYDCFIKSFSNATLASPNAITLCDQSQGISCRIPVADGTTVSASAKYITVGQDRYKIGNTMTSPVCSLAYTPDYIAAGHVDGSLTTINRLTNGVVEAARCHKALVSSIICIPSQNLCLLGGGNTVTLMKWSDLQYNNTGEAFISLQHHVLSDHERKKEERKPTFTNIAAVVGPFIVMKAMDNKYWAKGPYSANAFNAIQFGSFSEPEKALLVRIIDSQLINAQKNNTRSPLGFYEEEKRLFRRLCPTIQTALQQGLKE